MPNTLIPHPTNGTFFYGAIPEKTIRKYVVPGAPIVLKRGAHRAKGGFGVRHIWARHSTEMLQFGYTSEDDVPKYVADIVRAGSQVLCEFNGIKDTRVTVVQSRIGVAILGHDAYHGHYSVITAYSQRDPHGTRIGSVTIYTPPAAGEDEAGD